MSTGRHHRGRGDYWRCVNKSCGFRWGDKGKDALEFQGIVFPSQASLDKGGMSVASDEEVELFVKAVDDESEHADVASAGPVATATGMFVPSKG